MHSRWSSSSFLSFSKFPLIQEGGPKFFRETNSAKRLNYLVTPSLFQEFEWPNSATFSRAQCILHDAAVPFSNFENFFKLKSGDIFSCGEKILQNGWIICAPFCISRIWMAQILSHLLDFNAFYMVQQSFYQFFKIWSNLRRGIYLQGRTNSTERLNYLIPPSLFQF